MESTILCMYVCQKRVIR